MEGLKYIDQTHMGHLSFLGVGPPKTERLSFKTTKKGPVWVCLRFLLLYIFWGGGAKGKLKGNPQFWRGPPKIRKIWFLEKCRLAWNQRQKPAVCPSSLILSQPHPDVSGVSLAQKTGVMEFPLFEGSWRIQVVMRLTKIKGES